MFATISFSIAMVLLSGVSWHLFFNHLTARVFNHYRAEPWWRKNCVELVNAFSNQLKVEVLGIHVPDHKFLFVLPVRPGTPMLVRVTASAPVHGRKSVEVPLDVFYQFAHNFAVGKISRKDFFDLWKHKLAATAGAWDGSYPFRLPEE